MKPEPNIVFFYNPYQTITTPFGNNIDIINRTLRMSNLEKDMLQTSLVAEDVYNNILEFNASGSMIVIAGSKTNDKFFEYVGELFESFLSKTPTLEEISK
jgi:hypothetical protein